MGRYLCAACAIALEHSKSPANPTRIEHKTGFNENLFRVGVRPCQVKESRGIARCFTVSGIPKPRSLTREELLELNKQPDQRPASSSFFRSFIKFASSYCNC